VNLEELKKLQYELARSVVLRDKYSIDEIEYVIGVDQAFIDDIVISCAVKMEFPSLKVVEKTHTVERTEFPYIPTFLMFREGGPAVNAVRKVLSGKSVVIVDGSGIAHPRRCGLATYIAIKTGEPSIGITKRKLYGDIVRRGALTLLVDGDEVIGYELKTCKRCKPIYVSPGSYISLETALQVVKTCLRGRKLPEPIRVAHELAAKVKRELAQD